MIVVPGDEVDAVASSKARERFDLIVQQTLTAIDQVSGHGHQIRVEGVDTLDQMLGEASIEDRADVDIGDLDDSEAVQSRRPALEGDLHTFEHRRLETVPQSDRTRDQGHRHHRRRA